MKSYDGQRRAPFLIRRLSILHFSCTIFPTPPVEYYRSSHGESAANNEGPPSNCTLLSNSHPSSFLFPAGRQAGFQKREHLSYLWRSLSLIITKYINAILSEQCVWSQYHDLFSEQAGTSLVPLMHQAIDVTQYLFPQIHCHYILI